MRLKQMWPRLRGWELALLIALAALMLLGLWLEREQTQLSDNVLRLHVLANSDSAEDQALKLKVRDRILSEAERLLPEDAGLEEAEHILTENLELLARCGAQVVAQEGYDYPVTAEVCETWFPTKEYDGFSMPAGRYRALRVVIGEGEGQNWWCVVFPPLCLSAGVEQTARDAGLTEQQVSLLLGETEGYVIKFKALELWEQLKVFLRKNAA